MITISKLKDHFYPVEEIGENFVRCGDELPKETYHTYFMMSDRKEYASIVVSKNIIDDDFAKFLLMENGYKGTEVLDKVAIAQNKYGFSHILRIPFRYHSELKGRLDAERKLTTLCIPIFNSEFSGNETPEEFAELRKNIVPTSKWDREIAPKIALRFNNGKTKGGTGEGYVYARMDQVMREVENLVEVEDGFIEIKNYNNQVVEILFDKHDNFSWIIDRDDTKVEQVSKGEIQAKLLAFLTQ